MKNSIIASILALISLASSLVSATDAPLMTGTQFEKLVNRTQRACPTLLCRNQPLTLVTLKPTQTARLDAQTRTALKKAMGDVADVWPDTILEGGYSTNFKFRMDQIQAVIMSNQVVGYRFTFSAEAWDENENHAPGRIIEHGFLSLDLSTNFRDEAILAEFKPAAK